MKKLIIVLSLATLLISCNNFSKYIKIEGSTLTITNFDCGMSRVGFNQIDGDFETLDKEVFNALKGKSGIYSIKLVYDNQKDEFGNSTVISRDLEKINASELSNYAEVSYWVKATGGTKLMIFPN
ncbi:MAG: hypothetical protein PHR83_06655 [Paludibacter sp.]|nr:hypothetical protein [Paludibacter sp.]